MTGRWRCARLAAIVHAASGVPQSSILINSDQRYLPLLLLNATGRRRVWHVWLLRGQGNPQDFTQIIERLCVKKRTRLEWNALYDSLSVRDHAEIMKQIRVIREITQEQGESVGQVLTMLFMFQRHQRALVQISRLLDDLTSATLPNKPE
jgi:hypothetical protein